MIKELMIANPQASIVLVSAFVTLAMTLVTKYFTNQDRMRELKNLQKACQIKLKDNKGKPDETAKIQKEMFECSMEMTKHSMKPLLFTFIPLILLVGWLKGVYAETTISSSWLWWYIGSGIASSIVFRRIFKVV